MMSESALTVKSKLHDGCSADDLRKWVVAVAFGKYVHFVNSGSDSIEPLFERIRSEPHVTMSCGLDAAGLGSSKAARLGQV